MDFSDKLVLNYPPVMPKFKIGDQVERVGSLVAEWMRSGVILRVIPNNQGLNLFNEYEVHFGNQVIAIFYESELRLAVVDPRWE